MFKKIKDDSIEKGTILVLILQFQALFKERKC